MGSTDQLIHLETLREEKIETQLRYPAIVNALKIKHLLWYFPLIMQLLCLYCVLSLSVLNKPFRLLYLCQVTRFTMADQMCLFICSMNLTLTTTAATVKSKKRSPEYNYAFAS